MDNEKDPSTFDEKGDLPEPEPIGVAEPKIQFSETVRPDRGRPSRGPDDIVALPRKRSLSRASRVSIPQVLSEKDKKRRQREDEQEKKHVNITEHLMSHEDVASKYETNVNLLKPGDSAGLTSQQVEQLRLQYGLNVLTPPKKRHPFLKYLDYLSSLFNLLLIVAGVLEYILLGISFKDNFQNVSRTIEFFHVNLVSDSQL